MASSLDRQQMGPQMAGPKRHANHPDRYDHPPMPHHLAQDPYQNGPGMYPLRPFRSVHPTHSASIRAHTHISLTIFLSSAPFIRRSMLWSRSPHRATQAILQDLRILLAVTLADRLPACITTDHLRLLPCLTAILVPEWVRRVPTVHLLPV